MSAKFYGGNLVKICEVGKPGKQQFGSGPYEYYFYETLHDEKITFDDLRSFTLYLYEKSESATVKVQGISEHLMKGDRVQVEDMTALVSVTGGVVKFLVSGTKQAHPNQKGLFFLRNSNLYKVVKPWGHELWINGQHPCYALKEVFVKAGTKTSLQYHNLKQETNVLFKGLARLHFKKDDSIKNDVVKNADLAYVELASIQIIDVVPKVLHRLEAITDILLYETSTPHLDDVVRVMDDTMRTSGYLKQEHSL